MTGDESMLAENLDNLFTQREQKGKLEGKLELAIQFMKDFNLSIQEVAEKYQLPLRDLKERLNRDDNSSD
jgi:predicted transposase YdaD